MGPMRLPPPGVCQRLESTPAPFGFAAVRRSGIFLAYAFLVLSCSPSGDDGLDYPSAARSEQQDNYFGVAVADPYRWMEEMDAPETAVRIAAGNELVEPYLAPIPLRERLRERLTEVWIFEDHYDVPLKCFVPPGGESLLVAGRCLSAQHEAMASARVTAQCFSYGHAVGHAAAIAVRDKRSTHDLPVQLVRRKLSSDGARL